MGRGNRDPVTLGLTLCPLIREYSTRGEKGNSSFDAKRALKRRENAAREHEQRIATIETAYGQATTEARMTSDRQLAQPTQDYHRQMAESEAVYQQAMSKALADYQAMLNDVTAKANAVTRSGGLAAVPCGYPLWREWAVAHAGDSPSFVRFGQLTESGQWHRLTQPALLPLIGHRDALFKARSAAKSAAVRSIQPLLLRLLATLPPGKLRFTFIDPIGLGQNAAPFMHLADYDEQLE